MKREDVYRIAGALANATLSERVCTGVDLMPFGIQVSPEDLMTLEPLFRMSVKKIYTLENGMRFEVEFNPYPERVMIGKGKDAKHYINPPREYMSAWYEVVEQIMEQYKKIPREKFYAKIVD